MTESWAAQLTNPALLIAVLVALAVFGTFYTIAMPYLERGDLNKRMRAVSTGKGEAEFRSLAEPGVAQNHKQQVCRPYR
jgi:tight adherence protein C